MQSICPSKKRISIPAQLLGLYFVLLPFDCFRVGRVGSLLKIIAILPIVAVFLCGGCKKLFLNSITTTLLLFVIILFLSLGYTISDTMTISALVRILLNAAMILVVGACYEYSNREINFLTKSLVLGSWLTAVLMLTMGRFVLGRLVLAVGAEEQDANYVNGYMLFGFSFHLNELIRKKKIAHIIPSIAFIVMVLLTGSRGALLAYLCCAAISFLNAISESKQKVRNVLLLLVLAGVAYYVMSSVLLTMDADIAKRFSVEYVAENGTTGRSDIWKYLLNRFQESNLFRQLFGYGYGTTTLLTSEASLEVVQGKVAHNLFIELLVNVGVVGVCIFVGMQCCCWNILRRSKDVTMLAVHAAFIVMCMSLSLVSYKPIWALMMMALMRGINRNRQ